MSIKENKNNITMKYSISAFEFDAYINEMTKKGLIKPVVALPSNQILVNNLPEYVVL